MEQQKALREGATQSELRSNSGHDTPTAVIGLAGTNQTRSVYGTVVFDLTLFNEVTKSDYILENIEAGVIDSCIEVIIGLPEIRTRHLIHIIPSYFDTPDSSFFDMTDKLSLELVHITHLVQPTSAIAAVRSTIGNNKAKCIGSRLCKTCATYVHMGYSGTMCSATGRPYVPQERLREAHPPITEEDLIRKELLLDPMDDDDDIEWPYNPYEVEALNEESESPVELLAMITIEGSSWLQSQLKELCMEFIDVFATKVRREPAMVEPLEIKVDQSKWQLPCNRAPPRRHSEEKQSEIRKQVNALLKLGVIQESQATE